MFIVTEYAALTQKRLKQGYQYPKLYKRSINFIADTMILYLNSTLDLNHSCASDSGSQSFIATKCVN